MQKQLLLSFLLPLLLLGCKKESDTSPVTNTPTVEKQVTCDIIRVDGQNGNYITYEYDANNRIKFTHQYQAATQTQPERKAVYNVYRDANNRVKEIIGGSTAANESKSSEAFEYDVKGRWIKTTTTSVPASNTYSITVPEYNDQDFVIKATNTTYFGSTAIVKVRTYEYKDGNLFRSNEMNGDNIITSQYEYYLDKDRKASEIYLLSSYGFGLGTPSKKMLRNIKTLNKGQLMETTYNYVFDEKGYVLKNTTKIMSSGVMVGDLEGTNTYKCY